MRLTVHASIFSIVFAGFVATAMNTKPAASFYEPHSLIISSHMPVPNCPPDTGCPLKSK